MRNIISKVREKIIHSLILPIIKFHGLKRLPLSHMLNTLAEYYHSAYFNSVSTDPETDGEYWLLRTITKYSKFNIVDIGGHHGEYTKEFLKYSPNSKSLIIEPLDRFNFFIKKNLDKFIEKNQVIIKNIAASNQNENERDFFYCKDGSGTGSSLENNFEDSLTIEKVSSKSMTLDEIIKLEKFVKSDIGLIKIDVEGHEKEILEGSKEIMKTVGIIQMEYSYHNFIKHWNILKIFEEFKDNFWLGILMPNTVEIINDPRYLNKIVSNFNIRNILLINKSKDSHESSKVIMEFLNKEN